MATNPPNDGNWLQLHADLTNAREAASNAIRDLYHLRTAYMRLFRQYLDLVDETDNQHEGNRDAISDD